MSDRSNYDPKVAKMFSDVRFYNDTFCKGRSHKMNVKSLDLSQRNCSFEPYVLLYRGVPVSNGSRTAEGVSFDLDWLSNHNLLKHHLDVIDYDLDHRGGK